MDLSHDFWNLLYIPLMLITAFAVKTNWKSLFDEDLTPFDRDLLLRAVIFLLMPVVVLFHEAGHALTTVFLGGKVVEFHYGLMWGYVRSVGNFTPEGDLWISLSGNLVQIIIGLIALTLGMRSASPPKVALGVYLGIFSIAGTTILYALLSVSGLYGDWAQIYTSPAHNLVLVVAVFHAVLIGLLLWGLYGQTPRKWFISRTNLLWGVQHAKLIQQARLYPSAENWLRLGWCYYEVGLLPSAEKAVSEALSRKPSFDACCLLLKGAIAARKARLSQAMKYLEGAISSQKLDELENAVAISLLAQCQGKLGKQTGQTQDLAVEADLD